MKAVIVERFTRYDEAEVRECPDPTPGPGEAVIDLEASDVNFPDILYIEGKYQRTPPFPFSPGLAGAGRISAVGDGVDDSRLGERVLVLPELGTYASRVVAPADFCFSIPDEIPFDTAAALGLTYQTAYFALTDHGAIGRGDTVLVLGATGGIGMASIQLAKALGAGTVVAVTRGDAGLSSARDFGADVVIDALMQDVKSGLKQAVVEATDGHGVDIVIDPVGGELSHAALRTLAWRGRFVVVGFASGEIPEFAGNYLLVKNITISGIQWTDYRARMLDRVRAAQAHIFELCRAGQLDPRISARVPLDQYADALKAFSNGSVVGKIILTLRERRAK